MDSEVTVIGGGVMGCMAAFTLARRGLKNILLLESGRLGDAATGQSAAMIMHQTGDRFLTQLAQRSIQTYLDIARASRISIDLTQTGSILFTTQGHRDAELNEMLATQSELGIVSRRVDNAEIEQFCPGISTKGITNAIYCAADGYLSSRGLLQELERRMLEMGVVIKQAGRVTYIRKVNGEDGFTLGTSEGELRTQRVVNAAGGYAPQIASWLGDTLPVVFSERHLVRVRPPMSLGVFPIMEDIATEWYCRPDGRDVLIGIGPVDTRGARDFYNFAEPDMRTNLLEIAYEYVADRFPGWGNVLRDHFWAGSRPMTADGAPIISRSANHANLFHCAGMSAFGITTAPECAEILASLILEDVPPAIERAAERLDMCRPSLRQTPDPDRVDTTIPEPTGGRAASHGGGFDDRMATLISSVPEVYAPPFYLYDLDRIETDARELKEAFRDFELLYALKANPLDQVVRTVLSAGFGADVSSLGELRTALGAGVDPRNIVFGGPGKTAADYCLPIVTSGSTISVESVAELLTIQELARNLDLRVPVLLRLNSAHRPAVAGEFMAGGPSQFGTDEESFQDLASQVDARFVDVLGIHVHVASQILEQDAIVDHYRRTAELAVRCHNQIGCPLRIVNFGGGLGVPYASQDKVLQLDELAKRSKQVIFEALGPQAQNVRLQLELGRSIVANGGVFVSRVLDKKESRHRRFLVVESGISGFSRPAMPWAQPHRCWSFPRRSGTLLDYTVVGRSCLPADILAHSAPLQAPEIGDLLCMAQAGAYGFSMSLLRWSGVEAPLELTYKDGAFQLGSDIEARLQAPGGPEPAALDAA